MTLREYLKANKISYKTFADTIGVHELTVHRFVHNQRVPQRQVMAKIITATKGEITADSFFAEASAA